MKFNIKLQKFIQSTKKIYLSAFFIWLIVLILSPGNVSSQSITDRDYKLSSEGYSLKDIREKLLITDSTKKKSTEKVVFSMKKSPWRAVAYSAILPGAGQFYNESYWKIPIIAGLGGYFVYEIVINNNQYLDYKDQYANSQTPQNPQGNIQLQNYREFYRDQRDNFIIYSLILYVVNLIDAYVDAQLYDFNVSDKIKFSVSQKDKILNLSYGF